MTSPFSPPATGGNRMEWESVLGELLVFVPIAVKDDGVDTQHGIAYPVVADVHVLSGDKQGDYEPECWVFPKVLISQLEPKVSKDGSVLVLGRLIKEPTKKGNPAWKLAEATPADNEVGARWHAWRISQGLPFTSVAKASFTAPAASAQPPNPAPAAASPAPAAPLADQIAADAAAMKTAAPSGAGAGNPPF
jgi:hypothetical protein